MGVNALHDDYKAYSPKWKRCRDVIAGQDAMHAAGTDYIPRLTNEADADYQARIKRSDFFNGTWRTIDALVGMAFRKPPQIEVPAAVKPMLDDINMRGKPMDGFAKDILEEDLSVGRVGILVDHPAQPENVTPLTQATAEKLGMRPTLQLYTTENIRNWRFERLNNSWVLAMVVLGEMATIPGDDEFTPGQQEQFRVLDLGGENSTYRQRLFIVNDKGEDVLLSETVPLMNGKPLTYIPFTLLGACGRDDDIDEPPLIDLIDKNVAHYQVSSDYRHALHFTGMPTLFLAGVQNDDKDSPIYLGGSAAVTSDHPEAKGEYIEYKGQGLKSVENALTRLETQMSLLGARMIADETKQVETLGATQIKRQGENSVLAKIVNAVSEGIEWALSVFSEWAGAAPGKIKYQINRDFLPALMDGRELMALVQAYTAGALSNQEFFDLMQRGDVIRGDKTFEQHQEETRSQPTPAKPMPPPNQNSGQAA